MESELSYNTQIFDKDIETMENPKITETLLKELGFKPYWNNALDMYVFKLEDVTVYDTVHGFKYDRTGTIIETLSDLQKEVTDEWGEPLETEY